MSELKKAKEAKKIIIATGGTGGHIFPALACIKGLQEDDISVVLSINKKLIMPLKAR